MVMDLLGEDLPVQLDIARRRYRCNACGHPLLEVLPGVESHRRMTTRLVETIQHRLFLEPASVLARKFGLDEKSIRNLGEDYYRSLADNTRIAIPQVLSIAEAEAAGRSAVLLTDATRGTVFELLKKDSSKELRVLLLKLLEPGWPKTLHVGFDGPILDAVAAIVPASTTVLLFTPSLAWRLEAQFRAVIANLRGWEGQAVTIERRVVGSAYEGLVDLPPVGEELLRTTVEEVLAGWPEVRTHWMAYRDLQALIAQPPERWLADLAAWNGVYPNAVRRPYRWLEPLLHRALGVSSQVVAGALADPHHRARLYLVRELLRFYSPKRSWQVVHGLVMYQLDLHSHAPAGGEVAVNFGTSLDRLGERLRSQLTGFDPS